MTFASYAHEFQGKRALVTGGTKGMGYAIAKRLAGAGAAVIATARTIPTDYDVPGVRFVSADITKPRARRCSSKP